MSKLIIFVGKINKNVVNEIKGFSHSYVYYDDRNAFLSEPDLAK